jgi:hypothetical protein
MKHESAFYEAPRQRTVGAWARAEAVLDDASRVVCVYSFVAILVSLATHTMRCHENSRRPAPGSWHLSRRNTQEMSTRRSAQAGVTPTGLRSGREAASRKGIFGGGPVVYESAVDEVATRCASSARVLVVRHPDRIQLLA